MKKRYRLSLEYEVEVKDFSTVPVRRDEWPPDTPGEHIVQRLAAVKQLLGRMLEQPEVLDAYLRFLVLEKVAEDFELTAMANRLGVPLEHAEILRPVLEELDETASRHFEEAGWHENAYEATVPLYDAFREKLTEVSLEEVEAKE